MIASCTAIIPAYNSAQYVADAIESALAQTARPSQIIVVNDGSTDNTDAVLAPYENRITTIRQKNQGLPAARNTGLRAATGDCIAFLDADDCWHPRKIELQMEILNRRPDIGAVGTATFEHPAPVMPALAAEIPLQEVPLTRLLVRNCVTASSVMVRREIADRVGEFNPTLPNAEDLDYWQRSAELSGFAILKSPLTGYRLVPGSLSRRPIAMETGIRSVLKMLDERDAWRGRPWLRRKAISHLHYSCANLYAAAGQPAVALKRLLQSLAWYPLPFDRSETGAAMVRPRRAAVLLLRLLHLMRPEGLA